MKAKKNIPQGLIDQALSDYQTYEKYKEESKMNTVCYLCQDCGNYMGLLNNGDPNPDHCDCDTDMRSWRKMSERDCYKFRNDKSNWEESK